MKTMKKYIQQITIAIVTLLVSGLTSCNDWLDLKPESEIILDEFWQSEADVESVLASCYRGLTEADVVYRMIVWGELRSDNVVNGSNFPNARYDMQRILEGDITPTNAYASWGGFYAVINYCNNLLYYAPYVLERDYNFTQADLQRLQAEVYAIRALSYFYLVRSFRDVPLILEASIDDTQDYDKTKATESEVIAQIIKDLLEAKKYARVDFGSKASNKGRITKAAVNSILADVYLWNGQYDESIAACNEVLDNKSYKLVDASLMLSQVFYIGNSTESIFELQFKDRVLENTPVMNLYGIGSEPLGEFSFPVTLAHAYFDDGSIEIGAYSPFVYRVSTTIIESENDIRSKDFYRHSGGKFYVFKYAGIGRQESPMGHSTYRYRNSTSNWIIYRLSDIILMKAEALVQKGKAVPTAATPYLQEAVELVNIPYLRANHEDGTDSLKLMNYQSANDVELLVLRERQRELMFEGKRWYDLVRYSKREGSTSTMNQFLMYKNPGGTGNVGAPVPDAMYMPISKRELEANKKLKQNPYYEESGSSSKR
jgi:starch-binding outer membrane protein, SusD/RagB family